MAADLPVVSYVALYIAAVYVVETSSRTSTHWRLNSDTGKVEIVAFAADGGSSSETPHDPVLQMLSSRVLVGNGEWKLEAGPSPCCNACHSQSESFENKPNTRFCGIVF